MTIRLNFLSNKWQNGLSYNSTYFITLKKENLESFRKAFEKQVTQTITKEQRTPKLQIDHKIEFDFINFKNQGILKQMAPYGPQNLQPLFLSRSVLVRHKPSTLKDQHLKMMVYQEGNNQGFDAIAFGFGHLQEEISPNKPFDIVYHLEENEFQGNKTLQLNVKDIKLAT